MREFKAGFYIFFKSFREKKSFFGIFVFSLCLFVYFFVEGFEKEAVNISFFFLPYLVLFLTADILHPEISTPVCESLIFAGLNRKKYFLLKNIFVIFTGIVLWLVVFSIALFIRELSWNRAFMSLTGIVYFALLGVLLNYKMKSYTGPLSVFLVGIMLTIFILRFEALDIIMQLRSFSLSNISLKLFPFFLTLSLTFPLWLWSNLNAALVQLLAAILILLLQWRYLKWKF